MRGIYKITTPINNRIYIGSAVNIEARWRLHRHQLRQQKHGNIHLQRAFNKYGESAFEFSIMETVKNSADLIQREQYWLDLAGHKESHLYNIELIAGSALGVKRRPESKFWLGKKRSAEDVQKFKISHIGLIGLKPNPLYPGVFWNSANQNYRARITINHKTTELGSFKVLKDAILARQQAEISFTGIQRDRLLS